MAGCDILYNSKDKIKIKIPLNKALRAGNIGLFTEFITKYNNLRQEVRLVPREGDPETDITLSMKALDQDIQDILRSWDAQHPDSPQFDTALAEIRAALHIIDESQTTVQDDDIETKTEAEAADRNTANLRGHMAEFYGLEAFDIASSLKQAFGDMMASAAYYDINSGTISDQSVETLNSNIRTEKNKLFRTLVQYLKLKFPENTTIQKLQDTMYPNGRFNSQNYYKALNLFYSNIASSETFKDDLKAAHVDSVKSATRDDRTTLYKSLVAELMGDNMFKTRMNRRFTGNKFVGLQSQLYTADHYSEYYAAVKNYIEKYRPELTDRLTAIETPAMNVLVAANAYTMLRHFDSLLKDIYGDQISIAKNTEGYEADIENKYTYHKDTAHERKDWQTSEDMGSEKHISRFTNAVINMIRIYNYKTGEFLHRRADNTTLIVASRNLINAVLTKKVSFRSESNSVKAAVEELNRHILELHNDPVVHLQKILELLFEKLPNVDHSLEYYIENRQSINDYDLSVLKSVYDTVFNAHTPQSFYRQSITKIQNNSTATQSLLEEIAGFVDRNVTAAYLETVYDFESGAPTVRAKKKFFNNKQLYKLQTGINTFVNKMPWSDRQTLQSTYNLRITEDSNNTRYTVTVGGEEITLRVPNNLRGQILSRNLKTGTQMGFEVSDKLFNRLNGINLIEFRQKVENGSTLNNDETTLYNILQFLDDTLGLNILSNPNLGLQTLYSYQSLYNPVDGFNNYLQPLLKLGLRAAYANLKYVEAGENNDLATYLSDSKDSVYEFHQSDRKSKLFSQRFNNLQYQIASYADDVLGVWTDAQSVLMGEASKATTKDKQGNSIPNNSVAKLGGILHYYLGKQWDSNTDSLLFVQNRDMIVNTFHDLEVTNMQDESKSVRDFSNGELFFHAIFNKFWGSYLNNGTVIVQPTTYSDKTTFLNWEIRAQLEGTDLVRADKEFILQTYVRTIGDAYRRVFGTTTEKLQKIAAQYAADNDIKSVGDFRQVLHLMNEQSLVETAQKLGLDVELNKDYRIIKNKEGEEVIGVNGLLEYNANLYTDIDALDLKLNQEKGLFLDQLLLNGCTYQVLEGNDTIDMYEEDRINERAKSRNPILNTILQYFANDLDGRKAFMKEWIDADTGKMILAKQGGANIVSVSDIYDKEATVVLNPLLDKFFYAEGLLSNNLRFSLTGFEVNHPAGKKSPFNNALSAKTLEDWNKLGIKELSQKDWDRVKNLLDRSLDVDDLNRAFAAEQRSLSREAQEAVGRLLEAAYTYATNTSQGTQFKRNVIIPATLQYCMQNVKDGIPPQIKCAVIRDEGAPVYNYRGDHEKDIDSCDGSAKITPFQCILENKALGSQAVGFIKKPIWHAYDANGGTAFLAKFATDTMTNEEMRMSIMSNTSVYNIFKKATNLQWDIPIDLTKSLIVDQSFGGQELGNAAYNQWFQNVILGGNRLFYENKYGDKIEILGFNKTVTQDGRALYYTLEKSDTQSTPVKRYHLFHDEVTADGKIVKSVHTTTDTYQQAIKELDARNATPQEGLNAAHTINSLFELHAALGGIYCVDSRGNGSEFNNEVVVNFMNNVGWLKDPSRKGQFVNQETYVQPLKQFHIGYVLNSSAVKNGAKNMNQSSAWSDNSDLTYFEVDSDGLGMQMNADHDIVDSELTEFSQVIAATAAYGYTFDQNFELFHGLAKTAFQASEKTLKAVDSFLENVATGNESKAISDLYDSIGRIILLNQSIKDKESLTNIIMGAVQKVFNKYSDHTHDEVKIPFSDPNVYSEFISTLAATITKQSIKRKHPGSGCVMVPGYNMIQYFEVPNPDGTFQKLMSTDIIKRARTDYRNQLVTFLQGQPNYDAATNSVVIGNNTVYLSAETVENLEKIALSIDPLGAFSKYYTTAQNNTDVNTHLMRTYLAQFTNTFMDKSYFMPSDIVEVVDEDGTVKDIVDLDTLDKYYRFKQGYSTDGKIYSPTYKYRISVTQPHNLRPSLIRWKYVESVDSEGKPIEKYMNAFDLAPIQNAYLNHKNRNADYRKQVQDALHLLQAGQFIDAEGNVRDIIEGSLENNEAELVMSNIYKDTFGVENESLPEILEQGEEFFLKQVKNLKAPANMIYDMVFLRGNGNHTMITIGNVTLDDTVTEEPITNTVTNEKDEIVLVKGGQEIFEVGRWAEPIDSDIQLNPETGKFESQKGDVIDQTQYRLKDGKVQKRYDYVKKYNVVTKKATKNGIVYQTNVLYKVANVDVFKAALRTDKDIDAIRQQSSIIRKLYHAGDYKLAQINPIKTPSEGKRNALVNALQFLLTDRTIDPDIKQLLQTQIDGLGENRKQNIATLTKAKEELMRKEAHKKWVSFQDSLKFIASRIPAQTLQSFMAMKLVAWTENSKNMCYVSHFQTYLQGSDYDIDKAYIMGQSYDSNATYVKWSPYFDYTSVKTLEASKMLTVPKGIDVNQTTDGVDITNEIDTLVSNSEVDTIAKRLTTAEVDENKKITYLRTLAVALRKIERSGGNYSYNGMLDKSILGYVLQTFIGHEKYTAPASIAEAAYKNVASANIYAVSHDIRNRDQAYTAIAMNLMRRAAENSPKGEQAAYLSMLNPLTKYIMQYQNLVGKGVIGITANGEKFWFNAYYYWTQALKNGSEQDLKYLQFKTTLSRVQGRGEALKNKDLSLVSSNTTTHLPDLDIRDQKIRDLLINQFGATESSLEYRYVDQLISQLLSAATDNAKELILAKINAGTNFAKMYLYLMTMGYNLDDIAAFMVCPVAEFIDSRASTNMFQEASANSSSQAAISSALGTVASRQFLHGTISEYDPEADETSSVAKSRVVRTLLEHVLDDNKALRESAFNALGLSPDTTGFLDLDTMMKGVILAAAGSSRTFNLTSLIGQTSDAEINTYLRYCQDLIMQLRSVNAKYNYNLNELLADAKEFKKIYDLASEMSSVSAGYLGLNQGLPTDKLGILKRLNAMRRVISDREAAMEISETELFKETNSDEQAQLQKAAWDTVINNLIDNNSMLTEDEIRTALTDAHEAGIMNHFDVVKMLTDSEYKQKAKDYLHVIKGTINAIDMMDKIPHYTEIINCLRALVIADKSLATKSRLIAELTTEGRSLSDKQLQGIIRYADKLNIVNFLDQCAVVATHKSVDGFDVFFDVVKTNKFDLSTIEGISGFKKFIETDFLSYLKENYRTNPLVRHLQNITVDGRTSLSVDIDLLNPEVTTASKLAYDDILRGIAAFEKIPYNSQYTITDMLQLYNLIVNSNQYGGERLTTAFKVCSNKNSVLEQFLTFTGDRDYDFTLIPEYNQYDYQINAASLVSPSAVRFHTEPFIKVKDPVWDYVIMKYNPQTNTYEEYSILPALTDQSIDEAQQNRRRINFIENCPFEMPERTRIATASRAIAFDGEFTEDVAAQMKSILENMSISGKILIVKDC